MSKGHMPPRTIVFDLDGTLVDSVPDLLAALDRLAARRGLAAFSRLEVTRMVGDGAAALVQRALAARGQEVDAATVEAYVADYTDHVADHSRAYPGTATALQVLAEDGWRIAVCTNKPARAAKSLLAAVGLMDRIAAIGGGDSFAARKPDPAHLRATLEAAGGVPSRAIMVGDHRNDVLAATGAGVPCIFAQWGYGTLTMAEGATDSADRIAAIPGIADRLLPN